MNEFQATLTEALDISAFEGHARLAPGTYMVTLLRNARRAADGARLVRIGVEGESPVRLSRLQFRLLDGTRFFQRRKRLQPSAGVTQNMCWSAPAQRTGHDPSLRRHK
jgi:hypothetical protein